MKATYSIQPFPGYISNADFITKPPKHNNVIQYISAKRQLLCYNQYKLTKLAIIAHQRLPPIGWYAIWEGWLGIALKATHNELVVACEDEGVGIIVSNHR